MPVRVEKDGPVTTVIINRPDARNAVDPKTADELVGAFKDFDSDQTASVAVFFGEHGYFCAGWDLKHASTGKGDLEFNELAMPTDDTEPPRGPLGPSRLELTKPVIAAVAGPALAGGMELALWCDIRVMEEDSYFGVYCRRWGIPLMDGGTVRLPRLVGQGKALEIIMTGRKVPAAECYEIGLCEKLVPRGRAREEAEKLAHEIARFPQECMRADRRSVYLQHGLPVRDALRGEWYNAVEALKNEGIAGAGHFVSGLGRHGDFSKIQNED
ncbi:MAG: crotonase/enoyl-CoA hydratase family protein [Desulfobacteraceae bacterium]|nr:crotonase/enoyl-CoA hydratase family protein [Desulfobacteraceae bacterium]